MPSTPTFITTSGPAVEPITLEEMKTRLRVSGCDFDSELSDMLISARQQVEADTYRKLITQTVVMYQEDFVSLLGPLDIRLAPIQSITHVKYYDRDDVLQTFAAADYYANLTSTPPEIRLKEAKQWPNTSLYRRQNWQWLNIAGQSGTDASTTQTRIGGWWRRCSGRDTTRCSHEVQSEILTLAIHNANHSAAAGRIC